LKLTRDFAFTAGQPAHCSDGVVDLTIDRAWDDEGQLEHLVTVFTGFPPGEDVQGLAFAVEPADASKKPIHSKTNRRGQFRLTDLEGGHEYRLRYQVPVLSGGFPFGESARYLRSAAAAAADEGDAVRTEYHFHDDRFRMTLSVTPSEHVVLQVE